MSERTGGPGWNEAPAELEIAAERLERASELLAQLVKNARAGRKPTYEALTAALTGALDVRGRLYESPPPTLSGSARTRLLHYLERHEGEVVTPDELAQAAGIRAWERRIRELREDGHDVEHVGGGRYRLNPPS